MHAIATNPVALPARVVVREECARAEGFPRSSVPITFDVRSWVDYEVCGVNVECYHDCVLYDAYEFSVEAGYGVPNVKTLHLQGLQDGAHELHFTVTSSLDVVQAERVVHRFWYSRGSVTGARDPVKLAAEDFTSIPSSGRIGDARGGRSGSGASCGEGDASPLVILEEFSAEETSGGATVPITFEVNASTPYEVYDVQVDFYHSGRLYNTMRFPVQAGEDVPNTKTLSLHGLEAGLQEVQFTATNMSKATPVSTVVHRFWYTGAGSSNTTPHAKLNEGACSRVFDAHHDVTPGTTTPSSLSDQGDSSEDSP